MTQKKEQILLSEGVLKNFGVDISLWGKESGNKTIIDLQKEIDQGESVLIEEQGRLIRKVAGIQADVYYEEFPKKKLRLIEEKQVFLNGEERKRSFVRSIGEKMKTKEQPHEALIRGLQEELGVMGAINYVQKDLLVETKYSQSYVGLLSEFTTYIFSVFLTKDQFKQDGYIEIGDNCTTYFVWIEE